MVEQSLGDHAGWRTSPPPTCKASRAPPLTGTATHRDLRQRTGAEGDSERRRRVAEDADALSLRAQGGARHHAGTGSPGFRSHVPNDASEAGKALRLRQQYFLVSASLQDVDNKYLVRYFNL
jgi:hypothetical protein